jgi:hypothetical protein
MKRMIVLALLAALLGGSLFARDRAPRDRDGPCWGGRGPGVSREKNRSLPEPEKVSVTGVLGLSRGIIVIEGEGRRYYVPALGRYTGFIDGLKDGAQVSAEGYSFRPPAGAPGTASPGNTENPAEGFLRITKLTLNGRDYDLGSFPGPSGKAFPGPSGDFRGPGPCRSGRR